MQEDSATILAIPGLNQREICQNHDQNWHKCKNDKYRLDRPFVHHCRKPEVVKMTRINHTRRQKVDVSHKVHPGQ